MNKEIHNLLPELLCIKKGCDMKAKTCNYCNNYATELLTLAFDYDLGEIHVGIFCNGCKNKSMLTFKLDYVEVHDSQGTKRKNPAPVEDE